MIFYKSLIFHKCLIFWLFDILCVNVWYFRPFSIIWLGNCLIFYVCKCLIFGKNNHKTKYQTSWRNIKQLKDPRLFPKIEISNTCVWEWYSAQNNQYWIQLISCWCDILNWYLSTCNAWMPEITEIRPTRTSESIN